MDFLKQNEHFLQTKNNFNFNFMINLFYIKKLKLNLIKLN